METIDYQKQATDFLAKFGLTFKAKRGNKLRPWIDRAVDGHHYLITLASPQRGTEVQFDFWGSIAEREAGRDPTPYNVLACISSHANNPGGFDDWCVDFGYDTDSRKALATYRRVVNLYKKLSAFFTHEEIEALQEIH